MVQVVEYLTGKGVSKEEALKVQFDCSEEVRTSIILVCVQFFSEVDRDGEGQVDIAYLLMVSPTVTWSI